MSAHHHDGSIAQDVRNLTSLLEERGVVTAAELDAVLDGLGSVATGGRIVARAWTDSGFRDRLLVDGNAAIAELGYTMSSGPQPQLLRAVANSESVHNVVVCTLCSCYPLALLGPSPSWYKSEAYRSRVVRDPRSVLAEFGLELPAEVGIAVWDSSAETRYIVVPRRPEDTEGMSEEALAALVTRNGLIGTAAV